RPRKMKKNSGWIWLNEGKAKGILIGGCLASLMHLRGTKYWPNFQNAILFWEISESDSSIFRGKPVSLVDSHLTDLENSGVFKKISGMIVGRPYRYSREMERKLINLIKEKTKKYNFPILYRVDFGHTDPMITLPIGVTINP
ncbi:MAG: LD-carboxypeptidase, partial [Patescibacteria group bacterium]|nr:LD-carboxypeptidase [Patescibacteria group bacterium]